MFTLEDITQTLNPKVYGVDVRKMNFYLLLERIYKRRKNKFPSFNEKSLYQLKLLQELRRKKWR